MKKVLLADDDQAMLSLLKTLLSMNDYEVSALAQEDDVMESIRLTRPDFLLLDLHLGERNGIDIVRQIRRVPEMNRVKIIMASGEDKAEECLAVGADRFLLKPYMPEELLDILGNPCG